MNKATSTPQHVVPVRVYRNVFIALMALLGLTLGAALMDLRWMNTPLALAIAVVKALLIMLYFMHVRYASRVTWLFAGAAFLWLGIMIVLTLNDYMTRGMIVTSGR